MLFASLVAILSLLAICCESAPIPAAGGNSTGAPCHQKAAADIVVGHNFAAQLKRTVVFGGHLDGEVGKRFNSPDAHLAKRASSPIPNSDVELATIVDASTESISSSSGSRSNSGSLVVVSISVLDEEGNHITDTTANVIVGSGNSVPTTLVPIIPAADNNGTAVYQAPLPQVSAANGTLLIGTQTNGTQTNSTSPTTNVTSPATNVTSPATNVTSPATNVTSPATNVTSTL
ncbi:hypothetical protein EUX98_g6620 [Antrodiella citrinella]|uniref:Uncharacterized protein n=1 Tax=Antrodiella citrinella TaxID=2447956 RepID=A0A4S4MNJ2_9APHY|nr:hypothetical protein EUX98_g6620 [Antrodiella citrinella]